MAASRRRRPDTSRARRQFVAPPGERVGDRALEWNLRLPPARLAQPRRRSPDLRDVVRTDAVGIDLVPYLECRMGTERVDQLVHGHASLRRDVVDAVLELDRLGVRT